VSDEPILTINDQALAKILEIRDQEPDGAELALAIRISGINGQQFGYEMAMLRVGDIDPGDHVEEHGALTVTIPPDSVENMRGATLGMSRDLLNPGLTIDNPNTPSPRIAGDIPATELTGEVAERVLQVLQRQINPAIASHGGIAELVAVEDGTAYLRLGGGCQGCGMASVTLSQGIENAIKQAVPEIVQVIDVTDHASGQNPYYEAAKK
jgi:Fe/S biogenesis protein NfuA